MHGSEYVLSMGMMSFILLKTNCWKKWNGKQSQATYATDSSLVNKVLLSLNDLYLFIDKSVESNLTVPKEFVTGWINFKLEYKKLI